MSGNKANDETQRPPGNGPDGQSKGLQIDSAAHGSYGVLRQRLAESSLNFTFNWRGVDFSGRFEAREGGVRLTLHSDVASLPYSAEDPDGREGMLAVVDTFRDDNSGTLKVVCGRKIVIEDVIELAGMAGNTATNIVTSLTVLVLRLAPCLDLLAERAAAREAPRVANA